MKRIIPILLALALTLTLCACGKKDALATAQEMIGEDISALTAAIGEPETSSYASSCLGPGEDGELYYLSLIHISEPTRRRMSTT